MSAATPGPWVAAKERGYDQDEWTVYANEAPAGRKLIAQTYGPDRAANAKLIAAAHALADALEVVRLQLQFENRTTLLLDEALRAAGRIP